jgi:hypothetical protein
MRIVTFPHGRRRSHVPVIDAPIDANRITLLHSEIVLSIIESRAEWRIFLSRYDAGVLGAALSRLTGSRAPD